MTDNAWIYRLALSACKWTPNLRKTSQRHVLALCRGKTASPFIFVAAEEKTGLWTRSCGSTDILWKSAHCNLTSDYIRNANSLSLCCQLLICHQSCKHHIFYVWIPLPKPAGSDNKRLQELDLFSHGQVQLRFLSIASQGHVSETGCRRLELILMQQGGVTTADCDPQLRNMNRKCCEGVNWPKGGCFWNEPRRTPSHSLYTSGLSLC